MTESNRKPTHRRPFSAVPNCDFIFRSHSIDHALNQTERCIDRAEGVACIIGASGLGKSISCLAMVERFKEELRVVLLNSARLCTRRALLQNILFELGLQYRNLDEGELRLTLTEFLRSSDRCPNGMLLIIDEAHTLPTRLLEEVRLLTNQVYHDRPGIRLVLVGTTSLEERLATAPFESLNQRIVSRSYLEALTANETREFVRHQLQVADNDSNPSFDEDGLSAVFTATGGVPRLINQLCDHALLIAMADGQPTVTAMKVEEAWSDLQQLPAPWHAEQPTQVESDSSSTVIEFGELDDSPYELDQLSDTESPDAVTIDLFDAEPSPRINPLLDADDCDTEFDESHVLKMTVADDTENEDASPSTHLEDGPVASGENPIAIESSDDQSEDEFAYVGEDIDVAQSDTPFEPTEQFDPSNVATPELTPSDAEDSPQLSVVIDPIGAQLDDIPPSADTISESAATEHDPSSTPASETEIFESGEFTANTESPHPTAIGDSDLDTINEQSLIEGVVENENSCETPHDNLAILNQDQGVQDHGDQDHGDQDYGDQDYGDQDYGDQDTGEVHQDLYIAHESETDLKLDESPTLPTIKNIENEVSLDEVELDGAPLAEGDQTTSIELTDEGSTTTFTNPPNPFDEEFAEELIVENVYASTQDSNLWSASQAYAASTKADDEFEAALEALNSSPAENEDPAYPFAVAVASSAPHADLVATESVSDSADTNEASNEDDTISTTGAEFASAAETTNEHDAESQIELILTEPPVDAIAEAVESDSDVVAHSGDETGTDTHPAGTFAPLATYLSDVESNAADMASESNLDITTEPANDAFVDEHTIAEENKIEVTPEQAHIDVSKFPAIDSRFVGERPHGVTAEQSRIESIDEPEPVSNVSPIDETDDVTTTSPMTITGDTPNPSQGDWNVNTSDHLFHNSPMGEAMADHHNEMVSASDLSTTDEIALEQDQESPAFETNESATLPATEPIADSTSNGSAIDPAHDSEDGLGEQILREIVSFRDVANFDPADDPVMPEYRPPQEEPSNGGTPSTTHDADTDTNAPIISGEIESNSSDAPEIIVVDSATNDTDANDESESDKDKQIGFTTDSSEPPGNAHREDYQSLFDRLKG